MVDNFLEAGQIRGFPSFEKVDEPLRECFHIIRLIDQAIPLANSGRLHGDVSEVFEISNRLDDFLFGFSDLVGALLGVEFSPLVSGLSGGKELAKEGLPGGVKSIEEMFKISREANFVSGVEGTRGHEVAFEFQVGKKGVDDKGPDIMRPRKLIGRDIELAGLIEEDAQDGPEGIGLRGVTVGKVRKSAEIVAAGEEFAVGWFSVASGPANLLGVVLEGFREVEVVDGPDVRLINAHSKGDGGANDGDFSGHEVILDFGPCFRSQPRVIGAGGEVILFEERGERFGAVLEGRVDDGGLDRAGLELFEQMIAACVSGEGSDG